MSGSLHTKKMRKKVVFALQHALFLVLPALAGNVHAQSEDPVGQAIESAAEANRAAARSQSRVEKLDDEIQALIEKTRDASLQAQRLNAYTERLEQERAQLDAQKKSLEEQIARLAAAEQELLPLVKRMVQALDAFVAQDLPFLSDERRARLNELHRLLDDPSVHVAEKYRKVLEAYKAEAAYGHGLGAEQAPIAVNGHQEAAQLLRVGRVALYALTADGDVFAWDRTARTWRPAQEVDAGDVRDTLAIAHGETPAEPFVLAVPAAGPPLPP